MKAFTAKHARLFATLAIATFIAPVASYGASAMDSGQTHSVTVRYADLNPNSELGARTLYLRLRNAARTVCDDDGEILELFEAAAINKCEQHAIENAVAQVNRPGLTAVYNRRYPREALATVAANGDRTEVTVHA